MNLEQKTKFGVISQLAKTDKINILVIIAIWFFMVILVNPFGNFSLNDDWVYGLSVKYLLENGDFRLPSYTSANVFSQIFWGALFCLPFGFSFTALRFSTLTLGLIGVLTTYAILRQLKAIPEIALMGALLIALNPIYFGLSNTFMTDVPFFTLAILSVYFLISGLNKNSNIKIVIGIFLSYIALLIRQFGIVISLSFGFAYLTKKGLSIANFIKGFIPLFISLFIQFSYSKWLKATDRIPQILNPHYSSIKKIFKEFLANNFIDIVTKKSSIILLILMYLGCFLFPFIIIFFARKLQASHKKILILSPISIFVTLIMGKIILKGKQMPFLDNILLSIGIGPLTLRDTYILNLNYPSIPLHLKIFWALVTAISVIGGVLLIYYLVFAVVQILKTAKNFNNYAEKWLEIFIIFIIFSYVFLVLIVFPRFDRYILLLLPLCMMIILISTKHIIQRNLGYRATSVLMVIMLIYGVFTIASTHDYLAWNRTRWQALDNLVGEDRISPNQIDGGYEFNGWYLYNINYKSTSDKSYWWVDNDDYIISSGPINGYKEVKKYPFRRWLLLNKGNIFVLHKSVEENSVKP